jgi:site-specific recombinase XerD
MTIDKMIDNVLLAMSNDLTPEQLQHLSNVLTINLHGYQIVEECTQLVTSESHWEKVLRLYLATKRLENCSEGTIENYRRCITMMMQSINKRLRDITTNDLRYYLATYQEQRKISLTYLETMRHYINNFFTWVQDEGYIDRNPARRLNKVKAPKKIKQPYTAAEREILKCSVSRERDLALMEVLYSTAGRINEILALNRTDVNFNGNDILIYGQKGKAERMVYLTESASYHLQKYLDSRTDDNPALFVSCRKPYRRLTDRAVQEMLKTLGERTGIHAHPHKFRRSLLTDAGARGVPLQELQKYAGHVKPDTTMIYVTVREESVRASFKRLIS